MDNSDLNDHLLAGRAALQAADWIRARNEFEASLNIQDSPEGHDGLGLALWWLNEIPGSHRHRQIAYLGFKQRRDLPKAAMLAAWLAREQVFLNANLSAMRGWFARAERLIAQAGDCVEQGWVALWRASLLATPAELERIALQAFQIGSQFENADLETMALAFAGIARVSQGRVAEGMVNLDEVMAAATGGEVGWMTMSEAFCLMLSACDMAGDLERTDQWCRAASEYTRQNSFPFLAATCRTVYGSLLTATGHWGQAEKELLEAIRAFETGHRALSTQAAIKLADLRICQGRLEEAEALLSGYEDLDAAVLPLARLYQARGDTRLAKAALDQAINASPVTTLDKAPLLRLLVDVLLDLGEMDGAHQAARKLAGIAQQAGSDLLLAQAELAQGQVRRVVGDALAERYFQAAIGRLQKYEQSLLSSRARLEMAHLLCESDPPAAITWARAALASFERLGASQDAGRAAHLLQRLGVARRSGPRLKGALTQREMQILALVAEGLSNRQIADRLVLSAKTVEHHVGQILAKVGARSRAEAAAYAVRQAAGDMQMK